MQIREHVVHPRLTHYVRLLWSLDSPSLDPGTMPARIVPDGIVEVVFQTGTPWSMRFGNEPFAPQPQAFAILRRVVRSNCVRRAAILPSWRCAFIRGAPASFWVCRLRRSATPRSRSTSCGDVRRRCSRSASSRARPRPRAWRSSKRFCSISSIDTNGTTSVHWFEPSGRARAGCASTDYGGNSEWENAGSSERSPERSGRAPLTRVNRASFRYAHLIR